MAHRIRVYSRVLAATSVGLVGAQQARSRFRDVSPSDDVTPSDAKVQFDTSSVYSRPNGYTGPLWQIRNDYPTVSQVTSLPPLPGQPGTPVPTEPMELSPWMAVDFEKQPANYADLVKEYCFEGNVPTDFVVQNNTIRNWYHAPWMHLTPRFTGREPIRGLTFERSLRPGELSQTQTSWRQAWAIGFYNSVGAATFGNVWADPNSPDWSTDIKFKEGTAVFKVLLTDASDDDIPILANSPTWDAAIAQYPRNPNQAPTGRDRNDFTTPLRLLQVDWAVKDERSPVGWVFGTLMYDGSRQETNPWDRLTSVGIQWGNDPDLTEAAFLAGGKPKETWINPAAEEIRAQLGGSRPFWGWNGRLCGPVDNFVSACTSCHSTAQNWANPSQEHMTPPAPRKNAAGQYIPQNDARTMNWFRNVRGGDVFTPGAGRFSADYSLQLMIGWQNYLAWANPPSPPNTLQRLIAAVRGGTEVTAPAPPPRSGPDMTS